MKIFILIMFFFLFLSINTKAIPTVGNREIPVVNPIDREGGIPIITPIEREISNPSDIPSETKNLQDNGDSFWITILIISNIITCIVTILVLKVIS